MLFPGPFVPQRLHHRLFPPTQRHAPATGAAATALSATEASPCACPFACSAGAAVAAESESGLAGSEFERTEALLGEVVAGAAAGVCGVPVVAGMAR